MKRVKFAVEDAMNQTAASIYGSEFCPNHPTKVVSCLPRDALKISILTWNLCF
jgi:hypothetical protein